MQDQETSCTRLSNKTGIIFCYQLPIHTVFQAEIRFVSNGRPFKIFQLPNDHLNSNDVKFTTSKTASEKISSKMVKESKVI